MIFDRIEIRNMFSYRHAEFDLRGASPGCNIALISGRNGYGKTSFINAIKLLFVGPNEDLGRAVQRGRTLRPKEYVLGVGEEWLGIMNRQARRAGERTCEVRIRWHEGELEVEAVRRWKLERSDYEESLEIDLHGETTGHFQKEEAQNFLGERLPEDLLPFFFYDGEQIQQLAEAVRTKQIEQMERLLNIAKVETLLEYLGKVARSWRKDAMAANELSQQRKLEGEIGELQAQVAALNETAQELEWERDELHRLIREEERFLDERRSRLGNEAVLRRELSTVQENLEHTQGRVAQALIPAAPLLVNASLVRATAKALEKVVHSEAGTQVRALQVVLHDLPTALFEKPPHSNPPLTPGQVRFYRHRLEAWLKTYIPSPDDFLDGPLRLDAGHAKELLALFQHFGQADQERLDRAKELKSITQAKRRLGEIRDRLDDLSGLSDEEQREFRQRKAATDERKQRVGAIGKELQYNAKQQQDVKRSIGEKEKELRAQERRVRLSAEARRKVARAEEARDFFVAYKEELKRSKRAALQKAVNSGFSALMSSHHMIHQIQVDDHFALHFLDRNGDKIAMGSLSAGMKQLVATSLLWGLKEVSNKAVPLVIDTPIARIDRAHQENLLTRYYPQAGEQVIILPTDAELDTEKYALLAPHIYREYRLDNPEGDDTQAKEEPMYPGLREAANG